MKTKKESLKHSVCYDLSEQELRSSALCFTIKYKDDMASVKFLRYWVVGRHGDIIELYIEEKDIYVHLSVPDFLRCIKNYKTDNKEDTNV